MASARVFFSKKRHQRNGFISDEIPVVENGYDVQESDEDEVFVQDPSLEVSASRPLMHPRSKGHQRTSVKTRTMECRFCALCKPIFYFIVLVTVLCGVMATIVYVANKHKINQSKTEAIVQGERPSDEMVEEKVTVVGCDKVEVEDVWTVGIAKLLTESAFRLIDVNNDNELDVVFGFSTGADGYGVNDIVCDLYFDGHKPCFGGVLALEGATGKELWRVYTDHEIYGLNCQFDIDKDGVLDCLAAGRAGVFLAVSCGTGSILWKLNSDNALNPVMNFYTPQYIEDVDGDAVPDIITIHGGDPLQEAGSAQRLSGRILLVSGRTGAVLRWQGVPDNRESYYSPQILTRYDGSKLLLFGTGGETHNGSLWKMEVESVIQGRSDGAAKLSSDSHKGVMTPPALVDITSDGVEDIVIPMFNSTLIALDGLTFQPLWSSRFPMSESYSTPAVGFYNEDDVPDFLVKYAHGPGYPVYYYSETTVIDGKTGAKLIDPPLRDTIGAQSSPLTIQMDGSGNDVFLVWMADCEGHEGATDEFTFVKGTTTHAKTISNLCRLRFKSQGRTRFIALSSTLPTTGTPVYKSKDRKTLEHSKWVNTTAEAYEYLMNNPDILDKYRAGWSTERNNWDTEDTDRYPDRHESYDQPVFEGRHSIGSKKGPSMPSSAHSGKNSRYPDNTRPSSSKNSGRFSSKGNNRDNYNTGRQFSSSYLPSHQDADDYGYYRDGGNSAGSPYGSYYPGSDKLYPSSNDGGYYSNGYPYNNYYYRRSNLRNKRDNRETSNDAMKKVLKLIKKRRKRHVGPHDDDGLQRLISTGTLAPSSLPPSHEDYNQTIDLVFATYWFYPAKTKAVLPQDQKCISDKLAEEAVATYDEDSPYYRMSHEQYEQTITEECLEASDHQLPEEGTYHNLDDDYNPFDISMGQMTIYRLRLKFSCSQLVNSTDTKQRCSSVLPFTEQRWGSYMGSNGDSHWTKPYH